MTQQEASSPGEPSDGPAEEPIPPFEAFMLPVLAAVSDGHEHARKDVKDRAVREMNLTDDQLAQRLRGGDSRADSRAHWAIEYLCQSGAIERPRRGVLVMSEIGRHLLTQHPQDLREKDLADLPGYQAWVKRSRDSAGQRQVRDTVVSPATVRPLVAPAATPLEDLIEAVDVLDAHTAQDLIDRLRSEPPEFLERAVLKLLHAMGYGGAELSDEHLGRSHDGGLDGVIRQDALGLDRVYVQAKRYAPDNTVGSAAIREFVGALTGVAAGGGVFITTSTFSNEAKKYADRVNTRVILIDADRLGRLMVEYQVGVTVTQVIRVTEVDENFFDD